MVSVIIAAAGKGSRTGFEKNKLLHPLPSLGITPLEKTVQAFCRKDVAQIIIAHSPADKEEVQKILQGYPVTFVEGGDTRTRSVKNALRLVTGDVVLIHDGARPFVSQEAISACIASVEKYGNGVCALPVTDTVAIGKEGNIECVPDRKTLYSLQTPQGFQTEALRRAYQEANDKEFSDDSSVYAAYVGKPKLCQGNVENVKLTFAKDFTPLPCRIGFGVDTHAFGKEQNYIVLGGAKIPSDSGLIAHSDGDVLIHALMDALLSAVGERDIGHFFPDTSEEWKDADSRKMLSIVMQTVRQKGFAPVNASIAIQAQKPRLAKFIGEMTKNIATDLQIDTSRVGITAGTNEGLGYVGEGKGITVTATVLLTQK